MFIFVKSKIFDHISIAIPSEKLIAIRQVDDEIYIVFETGEMEAINDNENEGTVALPVTSSYKVKYTDIDAAEREMYAFYQALINGQKAFLFSNEPENFAKF